MVPEGARRCEGRPGGCARWRPAARALPGVDHRAKARQRLLVVPRHPRRRHGSERGRLSLQGGEVVERVGAVELAGVKVSKNGLFYRMPRNLAAHQGGLPVSAARYRSLPKRPLVSSFQSLVIGIPAWDLSWD